MEAAPPNPRKRGRPPSALRMDGVFTRSRSELFVHRTRSGRGRPDRSSKLINKHLGSPSKEDPLSLLQPRPSIKDLRARRVFSPTATPGECSPLKIRKIKDDSHGHAMPDDAALGKSQPSTLSAPELGGTVHVPEEGAGLNLDSQNVCLIREEKGLESSPGENHGNRADTDADMEFVLSDLSGVLYDLSGLLEFDGGGEVSSWTDSSSNEFLRTTRTLDFDLFHVSSQHDDGSIFAGHASSHSDCVLDALSAVTEGFCHAKMDGKSNEISADPSDNAKPAPHEVSKEVKFNGTDKDACVNEECIQMTRRENGVLYKPQLPDSGSFLVELALSNPDRALNSLPAVTEGFSHANTDEELLAIGCLVTPNTQGNEIAAGPHDKVTSISPDASRKVEFPGDNKSDCMDEECIQTTPPDGDILHKSQLLELSQSGSIMVGRASSDPDCALNSLPSVTEGFCHAKMDEKLPAISYLVTSNAQSNEIAADPNDKVTSISPDASREVEFPGDYKAHKGDWIDEKCIQMTPHDGDILHKSQLSDSGSILVRQASSDPDCALNSLSAVTEGFCHAKTNEKIPVIGCSVISNAQSNEIPAATSDKGTSIMLDASRTIAFNDADKVDFMDKDCIQTTPPDSDILHKSQLPDSGDISMVPDSVYPDEVAGDMPDATPSLENPTDGKEGFCKAKMDGRVPPMKRRKGVLGSHSRLKLFRTPDSLSYRRLLPYLEDLAKDNESSLEIHSCLGNGPFNIPKSAEGRTQPLIDSPSIKTNSNSCKADVSSVNCCSDLMTPSMEKAKGVPNVISRQPRAVECQTINSPLKALTEVPRQRTHEDSSTSCNEEVGIKMTTDEEIAPHHEKVKLESTYKLDSGRDCVISAHDEASPKNSPLCLSIEDDGEHGLFVRERKTDRNNYSRKDWLKKRPLVVATSSQDAGQDDDSIVQNHTEHLSSTSITGSNQSHVKVACPPKEEITSDVNRQGLAPCSQLKLFQTPNSLAYKRLLPFLMDLRKENAGLSSNHSSQEVELDEAMEERPLTLLLDTPAHDSGLGSQKNENLPLPQSEGLGTIQNEKEASYKAESSSSALQFSRFNCLPTAEIPICNHPKNVSGDWFEEMLSVSCSESALKLGQIILDNTLLEPGCEALVSVHATEFPDNELPSSDTTEASPPTREDAGSDFQCSSCSCRESIEEREGLVKELAMDVKPLQIVDAPQHSSHLDKHAPAERLVLPPKGILKKRLQDCKGLCTCQNCASFHLHAEKANELLSKQKQEAEEVAVGLLKELSCLRSNMEKSFSSKTDSVDGRTVVQTDQVRWLCRKARIAEEMARNHLRKMTEGLSNHCTVAALQRQRVRFADCVEEKHITKSEKEDG